MIMKNEMGEIPAEISVSDYRSVEGVLVPVKFKVALATTLAPSGVRTRTWPAFARSP